MKNKAAQELGSKGGKARWKKVKGKKARSEAMKLVRKGYPQV